jgi:hypothetical protein
VTDAVGGAPAMEDPLTRAEIEVFAIDRAVEVVGLEAGETVALAVGEGLRLPARAPVRSTPVIVRPRPIPPGGIRALLLPGVEIEPVPSTELAALGEDDAIVFSVAFSPTDAQRVDLRQFRAVAAQAADLDRRLVIAAFDTLDG